MDFLYLLEKIRNPILDALFSLITCLGEKEVFLVIAIVIFWCVNKRDGYYVLMMGLIGTIINQALKLAFRIPRPWVRDPSFTVVEWAKEGAGGYSFPSGHTQNTAGTFGTLAVTTGRRWMRITCVVLIILVAFSRMYLGVHTPADVCVSLLIAALLMAVLYPVFSSEENFHRLMPALMIVSVLLSLGFLLFAFLSPDGTHEAANLYSARKNASTLFGCTLCLIPVYFTDKYYTKFDTGATWYAQIVKVAVGLVLFVLLKLALSALLDSVLGDEFLSNGIEYFLLVAFAGILWPMTFKFFAKMRISALDKLFSKNAKT